MRQLKIGLIGVGNMGRNHLRILAEEIGHFSLVGIYDTDSMRTQQIADQYATTLYTSVDELLEQVEAVVIAVPSSLHKQFGLQAASHQVATLIEKPLAITSADAEELSQAFSKHKCKLTVGHVERFNPVITILKKILQHEKIIAMEARRYSPFDGRIKDANVVEDLMIHDIDLVCNFMKGHQIVELSGLGQITKSDRLDFVQSLLKFDNGVQATVSASRVTEDKIRELHIHTKDSFIKADLLAKTLQINKSTNMIIDEGQGNSYKQDSVTQKIFVPNIEPLRAEVLAFYNAVVNDAEVEIDGITATHVISICEQVILHAKNEIK